MVVEVATEYSPTSVSQVALVEKAKHEDNRGLFHEIYRAVELKEELDLDFSPESERVIVLLPGAKTEIGGEKEILYPVQGKAQFRIESSGESLSLDFDSSQKIPGKAIAYPRITTVSVRNTGDNPAFLVCLSETPLRENSGISIKETEVEGVYRIDAPIVRKDGVLIYNIFDRSQLAKIVGEDFPMVQWNHSLSLPRVIRGFHSEYWRKLVLALTGKCRLIIADVEPTSPTFLKKAIFDIENSALGPTMTALVLRPGVGNSVAVIGNQPVDYIYGVTRYWDNSLAQGFSPFDKDIDADFGIKDPIISDREAKAKTLRETYPDKFNG